VRASRSKRLAVQECQNTIPFFAETGCIVGNYKSCTDCVGALLCAATVRADSLGLFASQPPAAKGGFRFL
jgi:hypothetical protein